MSGVITGIYHGLFTVNRAARGHAGNCGPRAWYLCPEVWEIAKFDFVRPAIGFQVEAARDLAREMPMTILRFGIVL